MRPVLDHLAARFEDIRLIGKGGMCRIYRARDRERQEIVALKVMEPALVDRGDLRARFLREMRLLKRWRHPNLIAVHDAREVPHLWFSMEFLEGFSLHEHLATMGALPWPEAVTVIDDVLAALEFVHGEGWLHRDVKPGNVLLDSTGRARLADFGLAGPPEGSGLTRMGQVMGTLVYMPPEVIAGGTTEARSDLYAVGLILFECLAGQRYFRSVAEGQLREPACDLEASLPGDLPEALRGLVHDLLQLSLERRPKDAAAARRVLRPLLGAPPADQERFHALRELVTLDLMTLGPLHQSLRFLAKLSQAQRSEYLEDFENLKELRLRSWEVERRTTRFERLSDDTSVKGVDAWKVLAADLGKSLRPMFEERNWERVHQAAEGVHVTVEALRRTLGWARVRPLETVYPLLAGRYRRDLKLVLPEQDVPVYGFPDAEEVRIRLVDEFARVLDRCHRADKLVALIVQHRVEQLEWVVELKGRDLRVDPATLEGDPGGGLARVSARGDGGLELRLPALLRMPS